MLRMMVVPVDQGDQQEFGTGAPFSEAAAVAAGAAAGNRPRRLRQAKILLDV